MTDNQIAELITLGAGLLTLAVMFGYKLGYAEGRLKGRDEAATDSEPKVAVPHDGGKP